MQYRGPEAEIIPTLDELGIGFVPFALLGAGFLTGKGRFEDRVRQDYFRSSVPRFAAEVREAKLALVDLIREVATHRSLG